MVPTQEAVYIAFGLTIFAGFSTGIGSLMALYAKPFHPKVLAGALGFSAGVMVYVALREIMTKAEDALVGYYGQSLGPWVTIVAFFVGIGIIAIIDQCIPSGENPHEMKNTKDNVEGDKQKKLLRMGVFSAIAIGIHNFPEGLATFMGALSDPTLGLSIAIAVAIHNIPEGVAVSIPIYHATKSKARAFWYSFLSGVAEPVGALIGYIFLREFFNDAVFGMVFAGVAGIMVYISLDELLPTAEEYGEHHVAITGVIAGMMVMAVSIALFM